MKVLSFRVKDEINSYLEKVFDLSDFINKAISFYILSITDPQWVLNDLRFKYPELYKKIGRRQFKKWKNTE